MATHSSALAWRIPGTEEPGGLPSSLCGRRVRHDRSDLEAAAALHYSDFIYVFILPVVLYFHVFLLLINIHSFQLKEIPLTFLLQPVEW